MDNEERKFQEAVKNCSNNGKKIIKALVVAATDSIPGLKPRKLQEVSNVKGKDYTEAIGELKSHRIIDELLLDKNNRLIYIPKLIKYGGEIFKNNS